MLARTCMKKMIAGLALASALSFAAPIHGADNAESPAQREKRFIAVLKSDAPKAEKAITCKYLVTCASKDAVPVLAPMLQDKELASWARITLEAIPDPAADEALRDAVGKTQGRLLIGVMNSIAYRRDPKAIDVLAPRLKETDAEVVASAAAAIGKIGGYPAARLLSQALSSTSGEIRGAIAEGAVYCAERFMLDGSREEAAKLYDQVRKADVPKPRIVEATRGAILARQAAGIPLLIEQLRSTDKVMFEIGLRAARELTGTEATDALMAELGKASPEHQALLLYALGDRNDRRALPAVLDAARTGPHPARIAAVTVLETMGDVSTIPVLLDAAVQGDAELAQTARAVLARLPGQQVDADLLNRLQQSSGKTRQVLIALVEERRIPGAMAIFMQSAQDSDPEVRAAALGAIGVNGEPRQIPDLTNLLKSSDSPVGSDVEKALMSIASRWGAAVLPEIMPLARSEQGPIRIVALHTLATSGGPEALAAVRDALNDKDAAVQDEAVRTLSTWANRWPDDASVTEPLLELAKSGKKPSHQILAIRGYLQYIQSTKKLNAAQKLQELDKLTPLITRPEEKRAMISTLSAIGTNGALQQLARLADQPDISEEACSAIVNLVTGRNARGIGREQRKSALEAVVEHSKNPATKKRAEDALKSAQ